MTTTLNTSDALTTLDLPEKPDVTKSPREVEQYLARTENPYVLPHPPPPPPPPPRPGRGGRCAGRGGAARRCRPPVPVRCGRRSPRRAAGWGTAQCQGRAARSAQ